MVEGVHSVDVNLAKCLWAKQQSRSAMTSCCTSRLQPGLRGKEFFRLLQGREEDAAADADPDHAGLPALHTQNNFRASVNIAVDTEQQKFSSNGEHSLKVMCALSLAAHWQNELWVVYLAPHGD